MDSKTAFEHAVDIILDLEGGYVNDPDDPGGETRFGISKRRYPHLDIPNLTRERAIQIYFCDYWDHYRCPEMPWRLGMAVFDGAVQHAGQANTKMLQMALHVTPDGYIGPVTLGAARSCDVDLVLDRYISHRAVLYRDLSMQESRGKFYRGWMKRLFRVLRHIIELESTHKEEPPHASTE